MIVPVNLSEPVIVKSIEANLDGIKALLDGGWLEGVRGTDYRWHAYCDEEGKFKGLPGNTRATLVAAHLGWPHHGDVLCGPVVFLGGDAAGDEADLPQKVIDVAMNLKGPGAGVRVEEDNSDDQH
jgi:hypothetical protein